MARAIGPSVLAIPRDALCARTDDDARFDVATDTGRNRSAEESAYPGEHVSEHTRANDLECAGVTHRVRGVGKPLANVGGEAIPGVLADDVTQAMTEAG
jgi:hypothetical protein